MLLLNYAKQGVISNLVGISRLRSLAAVSKSMSVSPLERWCHLLVFHVMSSIMASTVKYKEPLKVLVIVYSVVKFDILSPQLVTCIDYLQTIY